MAGLALLALPGITAAVDVAVTVTHDSGPNIKNELFRSDGSSDLIWEEIAFTFPVPLSASGDGLFRMFAGGDLNNIEVDWIDVTAGPFGDRTLLGTFAFPISDIHFTTCENPPHENPPGCPIPETVPGGMYYDPSFGQPVGDVEGRRNVTRFSAGTPGLIVPQSLLVGGTNLTISLFPRSPIFDLYIDRLELSYPIPESDPCSLTIDINLGSDTIGSDTKAINFRSKGKVPVAILTTDEFDASTVDASTVQFGPDGATPVKYQLKDVDGDGDWDLALKFKTQDTRIACGDTEVTLTAKTLDGTQITGTDSIKTVGCKKK
jgi:hypothetical protein